MRKRISTEAAVKEWARGFVEKCSEAGVDPVEMFKRAQNVLPYKDPNEGKDRTLTQGDAGVFQQAGRNIAGENWGMGDIAGETLKNMPLGFLPGVGPHTTPREIWHEIKKPFQWAGNLWDEQTKGISGNNGPGAGVHIPDTYSGPGRTTTERLRLAGGQPMNNDSGSWTPFPVPKWNTAYGPKPAGYG